VIDRDLEAVERIGAAGAANGKGRPTDTTT
jgi:hypothetical protein